MKPKLSYYVGLIGTIVIAVYLLLNVISDKTEFSELELVREIYEKGNSGMIEKIEWTKGAGQKIILYNPNRKYISFVKDSMETYIDVEPEIGNKISRMDYFQKIPNSNKCFVIRNDKVLLFDCQSRIYSGDSLLSKSGWNIEGNSKWQRIPNERIQKYLNQEAYNKYVKYTQN